MTEKTRPGHTTIFHHEEDMVVIHGSTFRIVFHGNNVFALGDSRSQPNVLAAIAIAASGDRVTMEQYVCDTDITVPELQDLGINDDMIVIETDGSIEEMNTAADRLWSALNFVSQMAIAAKI